MKRTGLILLVILVVGVFMLHDIDKSGDTNRLNPTPNQNDQQIDRLAHGTTQNQNSGEEATADGLKFQERKIITKVDGTDKMVYGFQSDGSYGLTFSDGSNQRLLIGPDSTHADVIKISKPGYDASTAADANLIFNSGQNLFKILEVKTATVAALTQGAGSGGSTDSGYIDIQGYAANLTVLAIATEVTGTVRNPNFVWYGSKLLTPGAQDAWATYDYSWDGSGNPRYTRSISNLSASPVTDNGYTIKIYILQETQ